MIKFINNMIYIFCAVCFGIVASVLGAIAGLTILITVGKYAYKYITKT